MSWDDTVRTILFLINQPLITKRMLYPCRVNKCIYNKHAINLMLIHAIHLMSRLRVTHSMYQFL